MALEITAARAEDLVPLTALVNAAYEVETGDSGVAFKKTKRIVVPEKELLPCIVEGRTFVVRGESGSILGCLVWERVEAEDGKVSYHFGPFAVDPNAQGKGVGKALLNALYTMAREAGAASIDIEVVNWRSDIIPMYEAMGYVCCGEMPFVAPERITRPCHFILMSKPLA
jgi:GNAT superfamily N-acetyltransferase